MGGGGGEGGSSSAEEMRSCRTLPCLPKLEVEALVWVANCARLGGFMCIHKKS